MDTYHKLLLKFASTLRAYVGIANIFSANLSALSACVVQLATYTQDSIVVAMYASHHTSQSWLPLKVLLG